MYYYNEEGKIIVCDLEDRDQRLDICGWEFIEDIFSSDYKNYFTLLGGWS